MHYVKPIDGDAQIASVSRRDYDDATLVRVRTSGTSTGPILSALREALPLAHVSLVENVINGRTEAQVLVPSASEQRETATALAHRGVVQLYFRVVLRGLIAAFLGACVMRLLR